MNAKPTLPRRPFAATVVSASLAGLIAVGLFASVVGLFQRDGMPLEQLAAAERACAERAYVSERDACVRSYVAAAGVERFASRASSDVR